MQEKIKSFLEKGKQRWTSAGKKVKILLVAALVVLVAAIAVAVVLSQNKTYVTLFTELNQSDMSDIVTYLSDNGVTDYQIKDDSTILVPEEQEESLKAQLLMRGYPNSGFAYSTYFDHVGSLTTEAERNQLILYELQDRTAAVIRSMEGGKDATVQFTPGEDRTYVLDSGNVVEASAYAKITMKDGETVSDTLATGIRNLLTRSLQGLSVENVVIVDSYGNTYSGEDGLKDTKDTSALKMQLEQQVNNRVRTQVMQVLAPLYGAENVQVSVSSVVDVDRPYPDSVNYTTEDWAQDGSTDGEGIIGSKVYDIQVAVGEGETAGGTAGTTSNADVPTYPEDENDVQEGQNIVGSSGEKNYLVDTDKRQIEHVAGTVSDLMVSVSINETTAGDVNETTLYPHIARAAGIGEDVQQDKIHVMVAPFYEETVSPPDQEGLQVEMWVIYAALGGLGLFVVLLIVVLLLAKRRKKKKAEAEAQLALAEAAPQQPVPAPEGADIMEMQTEKSVELRQDVRKFAEDNPEIAAQMVKAWLKEGDGAE